VKRALALVVATTVLLAACGGDGGSPTPSASPTAAPTATPAATPSPAATVVFGGDGPTAYDYALNAQPSGEAEAANRSGWNCRTHVEYEGIAAIDFYIPAGTPVLSTMDGTATLYAISVVNDFDRYGVDREPYIGNPDRSRAPVSPFPGPSSGLGVYVEVVSDGFVTEYGHLDLAQTAGIVPASAFAEGYTAGSPWATLFAAAPDPRVPAAIASWPVRAGDRVGASGDAGYSEGPHLHYTVRRTDSGLLCPTNEAGFADGGWLFH
jgi:murein DD-endopeptidase MepM/ murein hydrolase activator NlpD